MWKLQEQNRILSNRRRVEVEKMSGDSTENITLEYIEKNMTDSDFKHLVKESYIDIIESFDEEQRTDACILLGSTLMYGLDCHLKDEETRNTYQKIIEISKIGINYITNTTNKKQYVIGHIRDSPDEALLIARIGLSLINTDRPIAAMEYLDKAERLLDNLNRCNLDPNDLWFKINYESCRA